MINYWQQAAGDDDRNYVEICLKYDVILNGPGYAGKWPECRNTLKADGWTSKKITDLKRFCEDITDGDIVVLRMGTSRIYGVGIVIGDYKHRESFGDVDGWDLQHIRRVKWVWSSISKPKTFPTYALKLGDTTQRLDNPNIIKWVQSLTKNSNPLPTLHNIPADIDYDTDIETISEFLFSEGISSSSIEVLNKEIEELTRIAKWYARTKDANPSEFETISYLAIPLLRALGWTPQKMAIEWNKVDIALFNNLPRDDSNLSVVIEAKRKDNSCLMAVSQAQGYANKRKNCNKLIVTDGLRYGTYRKVNGKFQLYAYLNIIKLKSSYPIYGCLGAAEALKEMAPDW